MRPTSQLLTLRLMSVRRRLPRRPSPRRPTARRSCRISGRSICNFCVTVRPCVADGRLAWDALRLRLQRSAPLRQIDHALQRLDEAESRLQRAVALTLRRRERLASGKARLESLNPSNVLSRGYSIVQRADGSIVTMPEQAATGERLWSSAAGGKYAVRRERE